jgi:hypothetical protein
MNTILFIGTNNLYEEFYIYLRSNFKDRIPLYINVATDGIIPFSSDTYIKIFYCFSKLHISKFKIFNLEDLNNSIVLILDNNITFYDLSDVKYLSDNILTDIYNKPLSLRENPFTVNNIKNEYLYERMLNYIKQEKELSEIYYLMNIPLFTSFRFLILSLMDDLIKGQVTFNLNYLKFKQLYEGKNTFLIFKYLRDNIVNNSYLLRIYLKLM